MGFNVLYCCIRNNNPTDWFTGRIDEVRLSNSVLAPSQFLFAPEPASVLMLAVGGCWLLRRSKTQVGC